MRLGYRASGPKLTRADIPLVLASMAEEWTVLAVGFWRDFHPGRTMYTTRQIACWLLGYIAKKTVCRGYEVKYRTGKAWQQALATIEQRLRTPPVRRKP